MNDEIYMKRAIALAMLATGHTSPNPLVGAVVVKDNTIIGEGYHHKAGEPHAEVHALNQAGANAKGATLYVTLEPCAHYGKTPPCAKRVITSGISRVVIGSTDSNPLVAGKGIRMLKEAGIKVDTGVCEIECINLNEAFFTYIQTGKPFVTIKSAMSLDGKIATYNGESQWITNDTARKDGHILRATHDAMLVGIGTILADDPLLNCRLSNDELETALIGKKLENILNTNKLQEQQYIADHHKLGDAYHMNIHQPDVIILDSQGRTPLDAKIFTVPHRKIHIFVGAGCSEKRRQALTDKGAIVHEIDSVSTRQSRKTDVMVDIKKLSIPQLLSTLGKLGYTSILVEGGSTIISSFVESQSFDKIITYIGNLIIGGVDGTPAVGGKGFGTLQETPELTFTKTNIIDNNIRIEAYRTGREGRYVYRHN